MNIDFDKEALESLKRISEETKEPINIIVNKLLNRVLDDWEDLLIAEHRIKTAQGFVSLDDLKS